MLEPKTDPQQQQEEMDKNLGNEVPAKTTAACDGETTESNQIREMQQELKRTRDEFNQQRAKMKELYLAKEGMMFC